jgi:hypothetical protein
MVRVRHFDALCAVDDKLAAGHELIYTVYLASSQFG